MSGFQTLNIQKLVKDYKIDNFIESGCFTGDAIRHALTNGIKNIYTCDINLIYVNHCKNQFPNAYVAHQHSVPFFKEILDVIPGNCFFWCDGHYPELYGQKSLNQEEWFPLFEEVKIISKKPGIETDIIFIDDIRVIISDDNPVKQVFDKQYEIHEHSLKEIIDQFPNHTCEVLNYQEGILTFIPKL